MIAVIELLTPAAFAAARLLAAVAFYLAILKAGMFVAHAFEKEVFAKLPLLEFFVKSTGISLAVLVFIEWHRAGAFDIDTLFGPESYWRRDLEGFLRDAGNPFQHLSFEIIADKSSLSAITFYVVILALLLAIFTLLPLREAPLTIFVSTLYIALTLYTIAFIVAFVFWALYMLNFWACLVVIFILMYLFRH